MRAQLTSLLAFLFAAILIGCSPKQNIAITSNYKGKTIDEKSLVIIHPDEIHTWHNIVLLDKKDFEKIKELNDEYSSLNGLELYKKYFWDKLPFAVLTNSTFSDVTINKLESDIAFKKGEHDFVTKKDETITLKIISPKTEEPISFKNKTPNFLLIITEIKVSISPEYSSSNFFGFGGSYIEDYLQHEAHFTIWNNNKQEVVTYGIAKSSQSYNAFSLGGRTYVWRHALSNLVKKLMDETPFKK